MPMTRTQFLLCKLAEEASEVAQIAMKCQQFGLSESMPGQPYTNAERTHQELDDLLTIVGLLNQESDFNFSPSEAHCQEKRHRVIRYSHKSVELGQVEAHGEFQNRVESSLGTASDIAKAV